MCNNCATTYGPTWTAVITAYRCCCGFTAPTMQPHTCRLADSLPMGMQSAIGYAGDTPTTTTTGNLGEQA